MRITAAARIIVGIALMGGCGSDDTGSEPTQPAYCNPLSGEHCLLPWPSSFFLATDSATATGYRVAYPTAALPKNFNEVSVDPTRYNLLDGFSIGSQPIVVFKEGVSSEGLPAQGDLAASVGPASLIWLLEMPSGACVPLFAEVDANAETDEPQALIIRPQIPLKWNTRYIVALRSGLKDRQGALLTAPDPFRRLRDGVGTKNKTLQAEATRIGEVLAFLEQRGAPRSSLVLAWDFHTASEGAVTGNLLGMVDGALAQLPASGPEVSDLKATDLDLAKEPALLRQVEGSMSVPSYLESDSRDARLKLDAAGKPVYRGQQKFPFVINIPRCAETAAGPLPVLIFGHGIFGSVKELSSDYQKGLAEKLCMVAATTNWIGLSVDDIAAIIKDVVLDFSNLPRITDQLQQAHVNVHSLVRMMRGGLLADPALQVGGKPVTTGKEIYYLGVSNGGIQGTAFAALQPDIERFVLHVPGGWWSMMMQRSSDFESLSLLLERVYLTSLDRLIVIHLGQHLWDYTDPITWATRPVAAPLTGRGKKRLLVQESRNDEKVPNLSTRAVVRGLGIDALSPVVEPVYGVNEKSGPLDSAYVQWDTHPPQIPKPVNVPPAKSAEADSAHNRVRLLDTCINQWKAFFTPSGQVVSTCSGPCDPD
jgi:hypothetical protein